MPPPPDPDRPRYQVALTFDPKTGLVSGTVDVTFTADLPLDRVVLRLWPNGGVRDAKSPRAVLGSARVAVGDSADSVESVESVESVVNPVLDSPTVVRLPLKAAARQRVRVRAPFTVVAPGERNDRISVTRGAGGAFVAARFGSFIPVLAWEPGMGWNLTPPTRIGAESSMTIAADWDVTLKVVGDEGLTALASGDEVQPGHWVSTAQRDWAMSIGRFNQSANSLVRSTVSLGPGRGTVKVTVGVAAPLTESASSYRTRVVRVIRILSDLYGDYPWPSYTLAITPGLKGGIEFPSHVMQGPGSIGRTTTHEVAHQWFYGLVGNDQGRDPWIDEGLATWAEARADGSLGAFAAKSIPADGAGRAGLPMTYWDQHRSSYYRSVYVQTLQAFNALGNPEAVDCALAQLVGTRGFQVTRPSDVIDVLTAQFPEAPLVLRRFGIVGAPG